MRTNFLYSPTFYTGMAALFLFLFVVNASTHGTALGLISTGGLAAVMSYYASRGWSRKRRMNQ